MAILNKFKQRVERVCLVDKPVDYPFLPDTLFSYMARNMPKLQVRGTGRQGNKETERKRDDRNRDIETERQRHRHIEI